MKNNNGITLVALIISIIVLLILAGISISTVVGDNGIISQATFASEITNKNAEDEKKQFEDVSDYINEKILEIDTSNPALSHSGKVPEGAYYANLTTGTFYNVMPDSVSDGDVYLFEDYIYIYSSDYSGWQVELATDDWGITSYIPDYPVTDRNQTSYTTILENINNVPITYICGLYANCTAITDASNFKFPKTANSWDALFLGCTNLTDEGLPTIPKNVSDLLGTFNGCTSLVDISNLIIPSNVLSLDSTFYNCTSLTTVPNLSKASSLYDLWNTFENCTSLVDASNLIIPNSVTEMRGTFKGCTSLEKAPIIPSNVTSLYQTFFNCTALTGNVTINANPTNISYCFTGTVKPITIIGSCSETTKANLASTANNNNVTY